MVRPKKEFKVQRNGNSIQLFKDGYYCGSLSLNELCELAISKRRSHTSGETTQGSFIKESDGMGGSHTNPFSTPNGRGNI